MDNQNPNNNTTAAPTTTQNAYLDPNNINNISMDISNISSINPNSTLSTIPSQLQPQPVATAPTQEQPMYVQQPQPIYMYPNEQPQYPPVNQNGQILPPPSYQQSVSLGQQTTVPIDEKGGSNANNQSQQPQQVVIMVAPNQIPRHSAKMLCPHCNKTVDTKVSYEDNALVWGLCFILFIFTFLCCIPFCIDDLKDVVHYCPICRKEIARRERVA